MIMTTKTGRQLLNQRKAEVQCGWANPGARRIADPVAAVAKAVLTGAVRDCKGIKVECADLLRSRNAARKAMQDFDRKFRKFLLALISLRNTAAWVDGKGRGVPFNLLVQHLFDRPDVARAAMFESIPQDLHMLVVGGVGYKCPLCEAEH